MKKIRIVDTTLRDGEQCPGIYLNPDDKIRMALVLDEIGVYEIEAGIFDRRTEGREYLSEIMRQKKQAKISLWARLNPADVMEACRQKPDIVHMSVPVSYVQIYTKLNKNKAWVEKRIMECMEVANNFHVQATLGFEDSSRADIGFVIKLAVLAEKLGVNIIRLADTVGIFTPERAGELVTEIRNHAGIKIEAHEHNDFGMAVANSLEMAFAGAEYVDCTLFGLGERSGNCNLYDFVHASELHYDVEMDKKDIIYAEALFAKLAHLEAKPFW